jgi:hypothetical protein
MEFREFYHKNGAAFEAVFENNCPPNASAVALQQLLYGLSSGGDSNVGFGEALPIGSNDAAEGRALSWRVKVWLRP